MFFGLYFCYQGIFMTYILLFLLCFHLHGSLEKTDDRCSDDPCDHAIAVSKRRHDAQFLKGWANAQELLEQHRKGYLALYPINYKNLKFQPLHDLTVQLTAALSERLTKHHELTAEQILALTATKIVLDEPSIRAMNCTDFENMHSSQLSLITFAKKIAPSKLDLEFYFYLFSEFETVYASIRKRDYTCSRVEIERQYSNACMALLESFSIFCGRVEIERQYSNLCYATRLLEKFVDRLTLAEPFEDFVNRINIGGTI